LKITIESKLIVYAESLSSETVYYWFSYLLNYV